MEKTVKTRYSLESLPFEVLESISAYIGGWSTFQLSSLSGSRILAAKLHSPQCVRSLSYNSLRPWNESLAHNYKVIHTSANRHPALEALEIQFSLSNHALPPIDPLSLPTSLTSLTIYHASALSMWYFKSDPSSLEYLMNGVDKLEMANIGALLPSLVVLRLKTQSRSRLEGKPNLSFWYIGFFSSLPSRLEHLLIHTSDHSSIDLYDVELPSTLTILDLQPFEMLDFDSHPLPHLTSLTLRRCNSVPFSASNAALLSTFRCYEFIVDESLISLLSSMTSLTSLVLSSNRDEPLQLTAYPPKLLRLELLKGFGFAFSALPRTLTHFKASFERGELADIAQIPPDLVLLHLFCGLDRADSLPFHWACLPRSLTHLQLINFRLTGHEDPKRDLPPNLTHLGLSLSKRSEPFSAAFVNDLPKHSLTSLELSSCASKHPYTDFRIATTDNASPKRFVDFRKFPRLFALKLRCSAFSEEDILNLPKQISIFSGVGGSAGDRLKFSGLLIDEKATKFDASSPAASFTHSLDAIRDNTCVKLCDPSNIFFDATVADLDSHGPHECLPSFTLKPSSLYNFPSSLQHIKLDRSYTHLQLLSESFPFLLSLDCPTLDTAFTSTSLTKLKIRDESTNSNFARFLNLRSLSVNHALARSCTFPPSLEELTAKSIPESVLMSLSSLKKLKIVSPYDFRLTHLRNLPRTLTSIILRLGRSERRPQVLPALNFDASIQWPPSLTLLDLPWVTMPGHHFHLLPKNLTTLVLGAASSYLPSMLLDLESCMDDNPKAVIAQGSKMKVSLEGRLKAKSIIEAVCGDDLGRMVCKAYFTLHHPRVTLKLPPWRHYSSYTEYEAHPFMISPLPDFPDDGGGTFAKSLPRILKSLLLDPLRFIILDENFAASLPPSLAVLSIGSSFCPLDPAAASRLPPTLTYLSFYPNKWFASDYKLLPSSLQTLEIYNQQGWDLDYSASLAHLDRLTYLRIECNQLVDAFVSSFPSSVRTLLLRSPLLTGDGGPLLPDTIDLYVFKSSYSATSISRDDNRLRMVVMASLRPTIVSIKEIEA